MHAAPSGLQHSDRARQYHWRQHFYHEERSPYSQVFNTHQVRITTKTGV
ncbi:hypothetical protein [Chitinophaga sp.]|nr:hypothetical protein [Chitinophaga sp.]